MRFHCVCFGLAALSFTFGCAKSGPDSTAASSDAEPHPQAGSRVVQEVEEIDIQIPVQNGDERADNPATGASSVDQSFPAPSRRSSAPPPSPDAPEDWPQVPIFQSMLDAVKEGAIETMAEKNESE